MKIRIRRKKPSQSQPELAFQTPEKPGRASKSAETACLTVREPKARKSPQIVYPPYRLCDFLMACRYVYYTCSGPNIIEDAQYDALEKHYINNRLYDAPGEERGLQLTFAGSSNKDDYTGAERALGLYFLLTHVKRPKKKSPLRFRLPKIGR